MVAKLDLSLLSLYDIRIEQKFSTKVFNDKKRLKGEIINNRKPSESKNEETARSNESNLYDFNKVWTNDRKIMLKILL